MGVLVMDKQRFCRKCWDWIRYDDYFGYCKKHQCQARHDDTCEVILEMIE